MGRPKEAAIAADDLPVVDIEALLIDAAETIALRTLVGIREEMNLEEAEPEGRAYG